MNIDGVDVVVKPMISMNEMFSFVNDVVSLCYSDKESSYSPEIRDFAIRVNVIKRYTNISLPDNASDMYIFVYSGNIFDVVMENINIAQFKSMVFGIDQRIKNINDANISAIQKEITSIVNDMEKFGKAISDMFGDVDKDTFNALIESLSNGGFDENKLAGEVFKLVQNEKSSD